MKCNFYLMFDIFTCSNIGNIDRKLVCFGILLTFIYLFLQVCTAHKHVVPKSIPSAIPTKTANTTPTEKIQNKYYCYLIGMMPK